MAVIVELDLIYLNDPTQSRSLFNAKMYFGVVDTDGRLVQNQVPVYKVEENQTLTQLTQPVRTNSGGNPVDDSGNLAVLATDGDYSLTIDDRNDQQIFYYPNSGLFKQDKTQADSVTLGDGQKTVNWTNVTTNNIALYVASNFVERGRLIAPDDYIVLNTTTIELVNTFPAGTKLIAIQNTLDGTPTGSGNYIFPRYNVSSPHTLSENESGGYLIFDDAGTAIINIPDDLPNDGAISVLTTNVGAGSVQWVGQGSMVIRGNDTLQDANSQMTGFLLDQLTWQSSER